MQSVSSHQSISDSLAKLINSNNLLVVFSTYIKNSRFELNLHFEQITLTHCQQRSLLWMFIFSQSVIFMYISIIAWIEDNITSNNSTTTDCYRVRRQLSDFALRLHFQFNFALKFSIAISILHCDYDFVSKLWLCCNFHVLILGGWFSAKILTYIDTPCPQFGVVNYFFKLVENFFSK
jgi:hypothetical protein